MQCPPPASSHESNVRKLIQSSDYDYLVLHVAGVAQHSTMIIMIIVMIVKLRFRCVCIYNNCFLFLRRVFYLYTVNVVAAHE